MNGATNLCEEIVIEILSRLPTKSLVRFLAVCRLWKSIITSPQFRLVSKRPTKLLVHTNRECYSLVEDEEENLLTFEAEIPLKRWPGEPVLMGSDKGLLCIGIKIPYRGHYFCVIIWNPSVRKHVVIPNHNPVDDYVIEYAYGFGGTISGRDYKCVRILDFGVSGNEHCYRKVVEIYSLKTGTWRRKYLHCDLYRLWLFEHSCALLRGRLHWIGRDKSDRNAISSFELEDEVFEDIIMLPEYLSIQSNNSFILNVTVIRESLAVITNVRVGSHSAVWVMEEYGDVNSWIKFCDIDLTIKNISRVRRNMVHLLKNGELLIGLFGMEHPSNLATYNPRTTKISYFGVGILSSSGLCGFTNYYNESLVLLGDHRAVEDHKVLSMLEQSIIQTQPQG